MLSELPMVAQRRRLSIGALLMVFVLLASAAGCGPSSSGSGATGRLTSGQAAAKQRMSDASSSAATHTTPTTSVSAVPLQALLVLMRQCALVSPSAVASAYDTAFAGRQVSTVFGTRQSAVTPAYRGAASSEGIPSCDYNASLAGYEYGPYAVFTVEWTTVSSLVQGYLSHRSSRPGDSRFALVQPPPAFTTAYEDNGGLFLARPGLAVTLGGALGSGVNSQLDPQAEAKIDACLSRSRC